MKRNATLLTTLMSIVLVAACSSSGSLGTVPPLEPTPQPSLGSIVPDVTPAPTQPGASGEPTSGPSSEPSATPTPAPSGTSIVRAYFILAGPPGSEGLVPYLFEVPKTQALATAAMNALLSGSPTNRDGFQEISSAIPAGTKLLGLSIASGVATVDLSGEFAAGGGSASSQYRLAQVVYTLTQFPSVDTVLFKVDGAVVTVFGSEGIVLNGPVGRSRFYDQLPTIFVDRPASGAALGNPGRVAGSAQGLFEATFRITLLDGGGRVVADQQAMAACFCESGAFDVSVAYTVPKAEWGTLRVWDGSAKDGKPENVREYPVWLTPAR
jgi:sporulation and spore germination protein/immunoglobulin-like protein involved in spore germination